MAVTRLTELLKRDVVNSVPDMAEIPTRVCDLWQEDAAQDIAEYAILLAVILMIVVGMVRFVGLRASDVFQQVASALD